VDNEPNFRIAFAVLFFTLVFVRGYYNWRADSAGGRTGGARRADPEAGARGAWILTLICVCLLYVIGPDWMAWSHVPLPDWLRWGAAALGALALALLVWTHQALGAQFSTAMQPRQGQALVTRGPYRRTRHPMYAAMIVLCLALSVLSASWLLLLVVLVGIQGVVRVRAPHEEALLLKAHGEAYRNYMKATGRYLPALGRRA
jgi:protein-S-isoprenylcysteine O-methyltransferase Ste14